MERKAARPERPQPVVLDYGGELSFKVLRDGEIIRTEYEGPEEIQHRRLTLADAERYHRELGLALRIARARRRAA
jgi:hypothetical protein